MIRKRKIETKRGGRILLTAQQKCAAIRVIGAVFQVGLGRDPEPDAIRHYLPYVTDADSGEMTTISLLRMAQAVTTSDEFRRRCGDGDLLSPPFLKVLLSGLPEKSVSAHERLQMQQCTSRAQALAFVASLPENRDSLDPFHLLYPDSAPPDDDSAYALWACARKQAGAHVPQALPVDDIPTFDLFMTVEPRTLNEAIQTLHSLGGQAGVVWALHLSTDADSFRVLTDCVAAEGLYGCVVWDDGGRLAGDAGWLAFPEPGDQLEEGALLRIAAALQAAPNTVLLFTDEDSIDENGNHVCARLKAGWSEDQLLFGDTVGDLAIFRRSCVEAALPDIGNVPQGTRQGWLYALKLAVVEGVSSRHVLHLPGVLLHRRVRSKAPELETEKCREIAVAHLLRHRPTVRLGATAQLPSLPDGSERVRVWYPLADAPPSVSIIIPTCDRPDLLRACLDGLLLHTDYTRFEVIVVDNGSIEPETHALLAEVAARSNVTVLRDDGAFNWARLNNEAMAVSRSDLVLLLNDDVFVRHRDWLEEMVRQIQRPGVGIVGARLLYPDDTIQHAGVVVTRDGATHLLRGTPVAEVGYLDVLAVQRDLLAVTGACLLIRRDVFEQIGGLDEAFAVSCNDIDLCLRAVAAGWRVVWTPHATLTHLDGGTRGRDVTTQQILTHWRETARLIGRWHALVAHDPTINPALRVTEHELLLVGGATEMV